MLTLNLMPIFRLRGIEAPFSYLVQNGFSRHSATTLVNGDNRVLKLAHIEKLCDLLVCEPNDLLAWTADGRQKYPDNYPLAKLKPQPVNDLKETLSKTPFSELKGITERIVNSKPQ